jgi:hypothetical protein
MSSGHFSAHPPRVNGELWPARCMSGGNAEHDAELIFIIREGGSCVEPKSSALPLGSAVGDARAGLQPAACNNTS